MAARSRARPEGFRRPRRPAEPSGGERTGGEDPMRLISETRLAAVLARLPGSPRVVAGGNFATPRRALAVLDAAVAEYRLFVLNAQVGMPDREGVTLESPFVGPGMRGDGRLHYFPSRLSLVPHLLKDALPPDVVLVQTSAPVDGTVSLGIEVNVLPAAIEAVRARGGLVIAQLNPRMPYTYGDAVLAVAEIDYAIEGDAPLATPQPRVRGEVARVIGDRVAGLVPQHATLQLGIGAVPDAVLTALRDAAGSPCGRRCSATACWNWRRPARWTRMIRSPPRSRSAARNCTTGSTGTSGCGCCVRRRPTTRG
jgi:Acetyl-CoA hydrolase/transferase N-terminal domain